MTHQCTAACVCPIHQVPLRYWPAGDDHACMVPDCPNAQGFRSADAGTIEVTITADTGRLEAALHRASMRGLCLAATSVYAAAIRQAAERQAEHARTQQLGHDLGLSRQDTDALIDHVHTEAAKHWTADLTTRDIYLEARRGLNARANGLPFLAFRQNLEALLDKPQDDQHGNGWPKWQ